MLGIVAAGFLYEESGPFHDLHHKGIVIQRSQFTLSQHNVICHKEAERLISGLYLMSGSYRSSFVGCKDHLPQYQSQYDQKDQQYHRSPSDICPIQKFFLFHCLTPQNILYLKSSVNIRSRKYGCRSLYQSSEHRYQTEQQIEREYQYKGC